MSIKSEFDTEYLFIANEPVIGIQSVIESEYLLHEGVFDDKRAYGRCWFISRATHHDNLISTNHDGVFTKCEHIRGLVV